MTMVLAVIMLESISLGRLMVAMVMITEVEEWLLLLIMTVELALERVIVMLATVT